MASLTGDGAERPEGTAPPASPPAPPTADPPAPPTAGAERVDAAAPAAPAQGVAPAGGAASAPAAEGAAAVLALPPPMAVPTVRVKPERPVKGITTASDYVAPRELPAHTPRPAETAGAKVVIHVPDAARGDEPAAGAPAAPSEAEVAELRQRRRAPTLKIDRNAVKELKALDDARAAAAVAQIIDPGAGPSSRNTAAPLVTDTGAARMRPLARPAAERPSPRRTGWIVALLATAVVGAGALAIGLGWVPGLSPAEEPPAAAAPPATEPAATPGPSEPPATAETAATAAPSASEVPSPAASAPPTASASSAASPPSAPPAASSAPRPAPWPGGRPPARPRPKSDIPTGI